MPSTWRPRHWLYLSLGLSAAAICLVSLTLSIYSLRTSIEWVGQPFWFRMAVSRARVGAMWTVPSEDGSRNGFGNPGWRAQGRAWRAPDWSWTYQRGSPGGFGRIVIPLWPVVVASAIACCLFLHAARRARKPGYCRGCGYSLEGIAKDSACPECGRDWWRGAPNPPPRRSILTRDEPRAGA